MHEHGATEPSRVRDFFSRFGAVTSTKLSDQNMAQEALTSEHAMIQGREGSFSLEPRTKNGTRYGFVNFTTSEEAPLKRETFQDGIGTVSRRGFQSDTSHQQLPAWAVRVGLLGHYIGMGFKLENVPVLTCPHSPRLTVRFANNTKGHGTSPAGLIASEPDSTTAFPRQRQGRPLGRSWPWRPWRNGHDLVARKRRASPFLGWSATTEGTCRRRIPRRLAKISSF